ncbi:MAG: peptide deformylase [Rhodospirillales bacterium]|jgi:peptide deformylase|nr:peptide deformylase [Rhodospirillales bacterium]
MAILKIARMGHPILSRPAEPVDNPGDPEIHRLIRDMIETMADAPGIGLAAPQVHVPRRVVIFHVPADRAEDGEEGAEEAADEADEEVPLTILINPVVERLGDEMALGWEGCLSVPGLTGLVPRFTRIRYSGQGPNRDSIDRIAEGFHARVVQHECDHLDGVLFPMRMRDLSQLGFLEEMRLRVDAEREPEGGPPSEL